MGDPSGPQFRGPAGGTVVLQQRSLALALPPAIRFPLAIPGPRRLFADERTPARAETVAVMVRRGPVAVVAQSGPVAVVAQSDHYWSGGELMHVL